MQRLFHHAEIGPAFARTEDFVFYFAASHISVSRLQAFQIVAIDTDSVFFIGRQGGCIVTSGIGCLMPVLLNGIFLNA